VDPGLSEAKTLFANEPALAGRFELLRALGKGSSACVFQVLDRDRQKLLALKVLTNRKAFLDSTISRFIEEFNICKGIEHPNLVQTYDLFKTKNIIAFTVDYIDGSDLSKVMDTRQLSPPEIDLIFDQLLSALEELHGRNIIHRDIKPENLILARDLVLKVVDLGLIKHIDEPGLTKTGVILGTAQYMPPEYVRLGEHHARGDIYACGMVLFELVTGKRRLKNYRGTEVLEILDRSDFTIPAAALQGVPKKYAEIIKKALAVDPDRRYQSAAAMRSAFSCYHHEGVVEQIQHVGPNIELGRYHTEMTQIRQKKKKTGIFVGVAVTCIVIMTLAIGFFMRARGHW
jgi:serine/threonine-protein kinase